MLKLVEQNNTRDGGHGLHHEIIHNHIRYQLSRECVSTTIQIPMMITIIIIIMIHIRYRHSHAAAILRTNGGGFIRHVSVIRRTHEEVTADDFPLRLMLVLGQEEERDVLTSHSSGRFGLQKYVLVLVWLNVSLAHIFHARVEVSEAAHHAVRAWSGA